MNGVAHPSDRALSPSATEPVVSAHSGNGPLRIAELLEQVDESVLQPVIRKAADEFYCNVLDTVHDYLKDNLDHNLTSHIQMLERENQRMRTELWEIDREIGGIPLGHDVRVQTICQNDRAASRYAELLWAVSQKHEGEERHETALRYIRERDSDGSGEAGETAQTGSTVGDSAGLQGIAPTQSPTFIGGKP